MMKSISNVFALIALLLAGVSWAAPAKPGFDVEVVLSSSLQKKLGAINQIERTFERRFRKHRTILMNPLESFVKFDHARLGKVVWANETLIGDADEYGLVELLHAMVEENLRRAAPPNFQGKIELSLFKLSVPGHSVHALDVGPSNFARGAIDVVDPLSGQLLQHHEVLANFVPEFTLNHSYKGPGFAFIASDLGDRIGPTLAYFVQKSLAKVLSDTEALASPVLVEVQR